MRTRVTPAEMNKRLFPGKGKMALNDRNWVDGDLIHIDRNLVGPA